MGWLAALNNTSTRWLSSGKNEEETGAMLQTKTRHYWAAYIVHVACKEKQKLKGWKRKLKSEKRNGGMLVLFCFLLMCLCVCV